MKKWERVCVSFFLTFYLHILPILDPGGAGRFFYQSEKKVKWDCITSSEVETCLITADPILHFINLTCNREITLEVKFLMARNRNSICCYTSWRKIVHVHFYFLYTLDVRNALATGMYKSNRSASHNFRNAVKTSKCLDGMQQRGDKI